MVYRYFTRLKFDCLDFEIFLDGIYNWFYSRGSHFPQVGCPGTERSRQPFSKEMTAYRHLHCTILEIHVIQGYPSSYGICLSQRPVRMILMPL